MLDALFWIATKTFGDGVIFFDGRAAEGCAGESHGGGGPVVQRDEALGACAEEACAAVGEGEDRATGIVGGECAQRCCDRSRWLGLLCTRQNDFLHAETAVANAVHGRG